MNRDAGAAVNIDTSTIRDIGSVARALLSASANPATNPLLRDRGRGYGLGAAGDVDGDQIGDFLIGSMLADPRVDPDTGEGVRNAGEAYLIYGFRP